MSSEANYEYAQRRSAEIRNKPQTELSMAEEKLDRKRAADCAVEIMDSYPEVHSMVVNAENIWGVWELEVYSIFDKTGQQIYNEEIRQFIIREVVSYSELIKPFEIHSGEQITLQELIAAHRENRRVQYGHIEETAMDKGLQTRTRMVPSKVFAIQFLENNQYRSRPKEIRLSRNTDQQKKNLLELQEAIFKEGLKLRLGEPKLDQDETGAITGMTLMVNGELSDGMAVHRLKPTDWLVVESLSDERLGEKLTNAEFRTRY